MEHSDKKRMTAQKIGAHMGEIFFMSVLGKMDVNFKQNEFSEPIFGGCAVRYAWNVNR